MVLGANERDELAYALTESDFDAVERDGFRAKWTVDDTAVTVENLDTGEITTYDAEDLVRAASDQEVHNARNPVDDA